MKTHFFLQWGALWSLASAPHRILHLPRLAGDMLHSLEAIPLHWIHTL